MRKPTDLLLPLTAVAYPFVVYFGEGRIAPPLFALILAAVWLIRAPTLLREAGGRWMIGAALAYCLVLALGDRTGLLRWYPTLVSALLLVTFGATLAHGPPLVERLARRQEPDLPPYAVRYTRKVTWVWVGFFAFNGTLSAWLALRAPLPWWTLYTGLIAYLIMGALFAGEWLLRRRLRRRHA